MFFPYYLYFKAKASVVVKFLQTFVWSSGVDGVLGRVRSTAAVSGAIKIVSKRIIGLYKS